MPNTKNVQQVGELHTQLEGVQALFIADYAGLTVEEQRELRRKVREAGGEMTVAKNNLLKIALKDQGYDVEAIKTALSGPNITLFAKADAVAPLKAMVEFAKANEKELPKIKTGLLGTEVLSTEKIKQLAALPSKAELISKLLGTLTNPARNLVGVLSAPMRNFVYALSAIKDKKASTN
jgi:large subunit ribosomal protein L10